MPPLVCHPHLRAAPSWPLSAGRPALCSPVSHPHPNVPPEPGGSLLPLAVSRLPPGQARCGRVVPEKEELPHPPPRLARMNDVDAVPPGSDEHSTSAVASTPATSPVGIPTIGVAPALEAPTAPRPTSPRSTTILVDSPPHRLRRTEDLLDLAATTLSVGAVLILAIYAHQTTTGVTQDVQNALAVVLRQILILPLQAVEGLVTFAIPLGVLLDHLLRGSWRGAGEAALAGAAGNLVALAFLATLGTWGPDSLVSGLTVTASGTAQLGISTVFATLAGLLTGAGDRRGSPVVRTGWAALWTITGLAVLRSALTLPGAVLSVLLGRVVGLVMRYAVGVNDRRAQGVTLVRALRRAGVDATHLVRTDYSPTSTHLPARAWKVTTGAPLGYTEQVRENPLPSPDAPPAPAAASQAEETAGPASTITAVDDAELGTALDAFLLEASGSALSPGRASAHRTYAAWDTSGQRRDVTVLDADRQVAGLLSTMWDRIRVKGLSPNRDLSVRPAAEHAALMTLEARRALVRTPGLLGIAEADESVLLVTEHVAGARSVRDLGEDVPDRVLLQLWEQLRHAHAAGLAHLAIDATSVVVDAKSRVWLLDWGSGETISSELSRRVDLAQALALTALTAGADRAIAAASRSLSTQQLASIAPMLQRVVLPRDTREAMGRRGESRQVLQELRDALVALTPTAQAEPARLSRFSPRTVIMAVIGMVALWTLLARMNFEQVSQAVAAANAWWILGALVFSLATYVGAGLTLVAFSPQRLSVWRSTEVHLASSVVALVAPAGVGGAAINLRFLHRKGVPTAIGVATVALVQVVQFVVTVVLLVVLAALTGQSTGLTLPSGWVLVAAGLLVVVVACALLVPQVRTWLWAKIEPTYRQVWPRLVWVMSNPVRLSVGISGAVLLSLSYILAFAASLWAFGYTLSFSVLAITYLASNTVGSVVPSPGGIGPVELALTAGLVAAGVPSGVALSTAIVYRLVTFWVPIPVGWLSLQRLQRAGEL